MNSLQKYEEKLPFLVHQSTNMRDRQGGKCSRLHCHGISPSETVSFTGHNGREENFKLSLKKLRGKYMKQNRTKKTLFANSLIKTKCLDQPMALITPIINLHGMESTMEAPNESRRAFS